MRDKPIGAGSDARAENPGLQDLVYRDVVLASLFALYPAQLRPSELIREITAGAEDFDERDGLERAVRDLVGAGLLYRSGEVVLPTRAALCFHEIQRQGI